MTIQTTIGALVQAEPALTALGQLKLSAKAAYHVHKVTALVTGEVRHFHETRDGYITDLGTPADDGKSFTFTPDAALEFNRRVTELAAVPVDLSCTPLALGEFGDAKVSAAELAALGPLFADPTEDA